MLHYAVFLTKNPGPFVGGDGPQEGAIVAAVDSVEEVLPSKDSAMAATQLELGCPRMSAVLPYLMQFGSAGWRSISIGQHTSWTNSDPNSFPV